ncbi:putative AraC family transcriptional regulator [Sphingomonas changbaiensis NBRC 104936]|uniref:Putative AraC family transcriptional regulator n=1 Tax=Sphingomonas changbaiensis NBRC 104936 TaxID=1219043 RepID=A0A0E9MKZ6_9SPHN|nr:alpha/beta fold hydrolase [Sphingomonas changbaiensis]GAO38183.1 putative AraC family transcriptional regulator [Sphingomonas changbaiensis NBRC 104936]
MDVLSDILSSMRLTGGVVIDAEMAGAWSIASQFTPEHCAAFFPVPAHVIGYHYVRSGRVWVEAPGAAPVEAGPGCIIIIPRNERHVIYSVPGLKAVEAVDLIQPGHDGVAARIEIAGEGAETQLYCGFLGSTSPENALLQSLPSLLLIQADAGAGGDWLESSLRFAAEGLSTAPPGVIARLSELLFGEAVRRYIDALPQGQGGWLAGLRDPVVARTLGIIHSRYCEALDMSSLAREVGLSRSALADRFTALIGEPPMRYCARWRMRIAANMLRDGRQSSGNVGYEVGFNSEAAFTRAFKREYGEPPAVWRRRMAAAFAGAAAKAALPDARASERIAFCTSADGARIGYSEIGEGFPLLQPAVWFHHVELDWDTAAWAHWMAAVVQGHRLIRSDLRGVGLSDPQPPRWTFEALVEDFEAVVDASGVELFDLIGLSHGALVALAYAARHPERVRKMLLYGGYAAGFGVRGDQDEIKRRNTLLRMGQIYRDGDREVFGRMLGALYWPGARDQVIEWLNERLVTIMGLNESLQDVFRSVDIRDELGGITAETLVAHSRGDRIIPHACSEDVAARIAGARMISVDSQNHMPLADEPAWTGFARELRAFLV